MLIIFSDIQAPRFLCSTVFFPLSSKYSPQYIVLKNLIASQVFQQGVCSVDIINVECGTS